MEHRQADFRTQGSTARLFPGRGRRYVKILGTSTLRPASPRPAFREQPLRTSLSGITEAVSGFTPNPGARSPSRPSAGSHTRTPVQPRAGSRTSGLGVSEWRERRLTLRRTVRGIRLRLAALTEGLKAILSRFFLPLAHLFHPRSLVRSSARAAFFRRRHAGAQAHNSSLLEPRWITALDALPGRIESLFCRVFSNARKRPLPILLMTLCAIFVIPGTSALVGAVTQSPFPLPSGELLPDENAASQELLMAFIAPELADPGDEDLPPAPSLPVIFKTSTYTVRKSDSIQSIAKKFRLRQDTIISANNLKNAASFKVGMELAIPNMDGLSHRVRSGDNLKAIAKRYGADITRLADVNNLQDSTLKTGYDLFIPGARLDPSALQGFYTPRMIWPLRGRISSPFGYRIHPFTGIKTMHLGLDIVANTGTPVKTMMEGSVADTGYNSVFGNYIIITHADNYQTLYGHLSSIGVREGQQIGAGSVVGKSGSTGQSTGPHLHFALYRKGVALNPTKYLK